jgi:hypothetical protein
MANSGRRKGDVALLVALASGQTVRDAAAAAGIGERTATRRAADPAFRRRVATVRAEMIDRATGQLADSMSAAARVLRQLLDAQSETVRLSAARSILELGAKLREDQELAERIAELETRLLQQTPTPQHNGRVPA